MICGHSNSPSDWLILPSLACSRATKKLATPEVRLEPIRLGMNPGTSPPTERSISALTLSYFGSRLPPGSREHATGPKDFALVALSGGPVAQPLHNAMKPIAAIIMVTRENEEMDEGRRVRAGRAVKDEENLMRRSRPEVAIEEKDEGRR